MFNRMGKVNWSFPFTLGINNFIITLSTQEQENVKKIII